MREQRPRRKSKQRRKRPGETAFSRQIMHETQFGSTNNTSRMRLVLTTRECNWEPAPHWLGTLALTGRDRPQLAGDWAGDSRGRWPLALFSENRTGQLQPRRRRQSEWGGTSRVEWDWNAEGGPPCVRATDTSEPRRWNWLSSSLAWGCQSQRPGCLIDLVGADSLPAEPLSASAVMQERCKEPLILLSDYLTFCRVI